jgi:indolepyruvate decarboxylase
MAWNWTVAAYLARRLEQAGVGHVFGVPGDFCLPFFDALSAADLEVVGTCNELNAGYAADGYARLNGVGALAVTWNVGGFSVLNAVAGASAERVPVVAVCGAPRAAGRRGGGPPRGALHHSVGDAHAQYQAFRGVVRNAVRLVDAAAAPRQIDEALATCLREKRPVYVELPVDVSRDACGEPGAFAPDTALRSDPGALAEAVARAAALVAAAGGSRPDVGSGAVSGVPSGGLGGPPVTVLAGIEVQRFGLAAEVLELVEHLGCPFVTTVHAKTVLPETHPLFAGVYIGALGDDRPREAADGAGVVLGLGSLLTDLDLGIDTARFDRGRLIAAASDVVRVGRRVYRGVALADFVAGLRASLPAARAATSARVRPAAPPVAAPVRDAPLTSRRFYELVRSIIVPTSVVLADVGDALLSVAGLPLPAGATGLCQAFYASIGWSVPATLGVACSAPKRRALTFVGDGAFQMTGMELSTLVRRRHNAVVFVLDNEGYLFERAIHDGPFNDLNPWRYAALTRVFGGSPGRVVATEGELQDALARITERPDELVLVQVRLGRTDASDALRRFAGTVGGGQAR